MRGIMKKFAVLMLALASLGAMTGCDDDDDSVKVPAAVQDLSLIHISEPTRH